jgi:hypothetical protein
MAYGVIVAFGIIAATSPMQATDTERTSPRGAPAAGPDARYCMRVEAVTGTLIERVKCWTREEWAEQGVDVDKAWAKEGVAVRE